MTDAEIVVASHDIGFDRLLCQTEVKTAADKKRYKKEGYQSLYTIREFHDMFPEVNIQNIWYVQAVTLDIVYLNKESLAAIPLYNNILFSDEEKTKPRPEVLHNYIALVEAAVSRKEFGRCISALPNGMRMDYFNLLIEKYPNGDIPGLYKEFRRAYVQSSYGFSRLKQETLRVIIDSRSPNDIAATAQFLDQFPEPVPVYRGGSNTISAPVEWGYSWSTDISVANFYATRLGGDRGYIACGVCPKEKVIAANIDQGRTEIFVDPHDIEIIEVINLKGLEDLPAVFNDVTMMYHQYIGYLSDLDFVMKSDMHGQLHEQRVLLLSLTIAHYLNLPNPDRHILAEAAIYHDTQRNNDGVDDRHGQCARIYYTENWHDPNPLTELLIEYHCLPDEHGYQRIQETSCLKDQEEHAKLLFDIFKDADALDRVRFGPENLDVNMLRLPISKTLTMVAKLYLQNVQ